MCINISRITLKLSFHEGFLPSHLMSTKRNKLFKDLYKALLIAPAVSRSLQQSVSYLSLASKLDHQLRYLLTAMDIVCFLFFLLLFVSFIWILLWLCVP